MSSLQRTALVIGTLLASISFAEAGGRSAVDAFPSLAVLPPKTVVENAAPAPSAPEPAAQPTVGKPDPRANRRAHRSRLARGAPAVAVAAIVPSAPAAVRKPADAPPLPTTQPSQEAAAKTPADVRSAASGPLEQAAPTIAALIAKHAAANGVPVGLAQAVVRIESRGNVRAAHAGALGLMQIKPGTARAAGFSGGAAGLLDAETNLRYGMKVLADAYRDAGGDICRALMKYQSGHLATHMTQANRTYCSKARAVMAGA